MAGGRRRHHHADLDDDNVVASGQSFDLGGSGAALSFLLTAGYGPASGTAGWCIPTGQRSPSLCRRRTGVALYMPYRNWASGQNSLPVCVYNASVALQAGKAASRVVLPDISSGVASGSPSLHIFAVTIQ